MRIIIAVANVLSLWQDGPTAAEFNRGGSDTAFGTTRTFRCLQAGAQLP